MNGLRFIAKLEMTNITIIGGLPNIEPVFVILEQLAYYTDELTHVVITHLNDLAEPIAKDALLYISAASFIPPDDRKILVAYLQQKKEDEAADVVLRNSAFETLYSLWDILSISKNSMTTF